MNIRQFKMQIELLDLGLTVNTPNGKTAVIAKGDVTVAHVGATQYNLDTIFIGMNDLSAYDKKRLFNVLTEYSSTKPSDRVPVIRYRLHATEDLRKLLDLVRGCDYLNITGGDVVFADNESTVTHQTEFTDEEIDNLPSEYRKLVDLNLLIKQKVMEVL